MSKDQAKGQVQESKGKTKQGMGKMSNEKNAKDKEHKNSGQTRLGKYQA